MGPQTDTLASNVPFIAIVPALPLPQTSAATDEEDDRLVKISLQRWLLRICEDPVLQRDEELRSFIESDFGVSVWFPSPVLQALCDACFISI